MEAPQSFSSFQDFADFCLKLGLPLLNNASPGAARQRIPGPISNNGSIADEMEGFSRGFLMLSFALHSENVIPDQQHSQIHNYFARGLDSGTNPLHHEYWGLANDRSQILVESAAIAIALCLSQQFLWNTFSKALQNQIYSFLNQGNQLKYCKNNWLLFNILLNTCFKYLGLPYKQSNIEHNFQQIDSMYLGHGWYNDGLTTNTASRQIDYYNAWGFHFYFQIWALLDGESDPVRRDQYDQQFIAFFSDFAHLVDTNGAVPAFGRSLCYRFGFLGPLGIALHRQISGLDQALAKTIYQKCFQFFTSFSILTAENFLSIGFTSKNWPIREEYSCGGSPYWAGKAFSILLIPKTHPFWDLRPTLLPSEKGRFTRIFKHINMMAWCKKPDNIIFCNMGSSANSARIKNKYLSLCSSTRYPPLSSIDWNDPLQATTIFIQNADKSWHALWPLIPNTNHSAHLAAHATFGENSQISLVLYSTDNCLFLEIGINYQEAENTEYGIRLVGFAVPIISNLNHQQTAKYQNMAVESKLAIIAHSTSPTPIFQEKYAKNISDTPVLIPTADWRVDTRGIHRYCAKLVTIEM